MESIPNQEGRNWIDYLLTRISDLIDIEEYERALPIAEQALEMLPDNPVLLYMISYIHQCLNNPDKSIQLLETLQVINPFDLDVRSDLGRNLMFQGYYHSALSVLNYFKMMSPGLARLNKLFIHYCLACSGDEQLVIEFCDQCIEDLQDIPDSDRYLAVICALKIIALINNQDAAAAFKLASDIDSEFDDMLFVAYAKGVTAWKNNDFTSAETFLRLACTLNPQDMRAKKDLAELLSILGCHEEAEKIRSDLSGFFGPSDSRENPRYRAEELIKSGDFEEGERFLSWACEQYPEKSDLNLPRISLYYLTNRYDSVISSVDSLENTPYAWKSAYIRTSAYYTAGDARAAIRCLIHATARDRMFSFITLLHLKREGFFRDPVNPGPDGMALMVFCTDGCKPAIPLFEMLVDTNPDILEYRAFLTCCYILVGRNTDAVICSEPLSVSDDPDISMIRALALRAGGCLEEAKLVTEETRKTYPGYVPALNMHVRILVEMNLYRDAYFELLSHQDLLLSDLSLMEIYIQCLIRAGEFQNAASAAAHLIVSNPERPMDYSLLAQAFVFGGNTDAALFAIRESFRSRGFNPRILRQYVKLLIQTAVPQEASIILSDFKEHFPNSPEIRFLKTTAGILSGENSSEESVEECAARIFQTEDGIIRGYIGDYRNAARLIMEMITQNPADYSLRVELAKVLFELRQDSEGLHQLSLAIENGEENSEILALMDTILNELHLNGSIDEFERIAGGDEVRLANLVYQQAICLNRFGVRRQAIEVCRYLTGLLSSVPAVQHIRAIACHMLGDLEEDPDWYEQGLALYDELLSENPANPVYLAEKGLLLDNLCRYEEAEDVLVRALEIDPDSGVANSALCWCLASSGRCEEALSYGNKAAIQIPDDWGAWNNRGLAKLGCEDYEGAASDFRQAIRCHPGEIIPRNNLCEALLSLDDDAAYDAYVDLLVRFGHMASPDEEREQSRSAPDSNRNHRTITGYMDGYW